MDDITETEPQTREEADAYLYEPAGFIARSRKSLAAGISGAAVGIGSTLPGALQDGHVTLAEIGVIATATIGGFIVAAAAVWIIPNAT